MYDVIIEEYSSLLFKWRTDDLDLALNNQYQYEQIIENGVNMDKLFDKDQFEDDLNKGNLDADELVDMTDEERNDLLEEYLESVH